MNEITNISRSTWDKAIWQYLIDHSYVLPTGAFRIQFTIDSSDEFFKRVNARYKGWFKRNDVIEYEQKCQKALKQFINYRNSKSVSDRLSKYQTLFANSRKMKHTVIEFFFKILRDYRIKEGKKIYDSKKN